MAVLDNATRQALWADLMRDLSDAREGVGVTKADLRAALNAVDDWVEANSGSFNTAIPQPARSALTARQKAQLLMFVVRRRFEVV